MMEIEFFGVRGSMPVPGSSTVLYGGNTSCVAVSCEGKLQLILDSGTGIVKLGDQLINNDFNINILITHNHWDHIQGFPFFKPIYQSGRRINLYVGNVDNGDHTAILKQMSGTNHPVKYQTLPSKISLFPIIDSCGEIAIGKLQIKTKSLNHPDGGSGYSIVSAEGKKLCYITDNELIPPYKNKTTWQQWVEFIRGADLLIHDGQYLDEDLPNKLGWGHSTVKQVVQLATEAKVKALRIISHDPANCDDKLANIDANLVQIAPSFDAKLAKEGMVLILK